MNVAAQRGVIRCRPLRVRCGPAWAAEHETPPIPRRKSEPRPITGQLPAGPWRCWLAGVIPVPIGRGIPRMSERPWDAIG